MIFPRLTLGIVLLALFAVPRPASADDTLTLSQGKTVPVLMNTLDLVAEGAGYYKAEHLIVQKHLVNSAPEAAQLCASGATDICPLSMEPLLSNYEKGLRLQLFLARELHYSYVLSVLDESPIKSLADFKGVVIGAHILGPSSSGEIAAKSMLQNAGLTDSDVSFVAIGYENDALSAILSKRVAGAAFPLYELIPYEVAGHKMRIFEHPTLKDVANAGYCAAPATINAKADQLARWSRAIVKAALFVRYNPAASARFVLQARGAPFTEDDVQLIAQELTLWEEDLPAYDPANKKIGYISPEGAERYSKILTDFGVSSAVVPGSAIVTDRFIDFANDFDRKAVQAQAMAAH
jgi:ABC-type nitrate/sulfonate/bicarbonate transport system substrate-binding protein